MRFKLHVSKSKQLISRFCWLGFRTSWNILTDVNFPVKLIYIRLCHKCFPGNFSEICRKVVNKNTSCGRFLQFYFTRCGRGICKENCDDCLDIVWSLLNKAKWCWIPAGNCMFKVNNKTLEQGEKYVQS